DAQRTWSPTGSAIAFVSDRFEGNRDVFTKSLGTGYVTRLTMSPADDVQPAWSPDGAHIAFASLRTGVMNIFEVPSAGGTVSRLTDSTTGSYQYPSWSPTGADFVMSGPPPSSSPSPSPSDGEPTTGLLAIGTGDLQGASQPGRYGLVILNAWDYRQIPALKAANPGIKVLVYKDMSSTRSYDCSGGQDDALLPTGV